MKKYFAIALLMVSCHSVVKPPKPDNLIPKEKMVHILFDLSLLKSAEGSNKMALQRKGYSVDSYVYERHNIDSAQFALSNEYYSYDLKTYKEIYEKVEDSLGSLKRFYEEKRDKETKERKEKDSLNRNSKVHGKPLEDLKIIDSIKEEKEEEKELEAF